MSSPTERDAFVEDDQEEEEDPDALAAEWALQDVESEKGRALRELNRAQQDRAAANEELSRLADDTAQMNESLEAQENLIVQLDAALGRGRQLVLSKRRKIQELKEQIRLQDQEYAMANRLLQAEMRGLRRLSLWWMLLVLTHLVLAYVFVQRSRLFAAILQFVMFMTHYRSLYIRTGSTPTLISLALFGLEIFWVARTFN